MNIEKIRTQLSKAQSWRGTPLGEAGDMTSAERLKMHAHLGRKVRPAGVLILLVERDDQLNVVLTQRTAHLHDHAGQISFPGGRMDELDADIIATALREAEEEVGTDNSLIEVVGTLPNYVTITAYEVTPVVARSAPQTFAIDPFEVADVFEVPLAFLLDPANQQRHFRMLGDVRRDYWAIPYGERNIWGATAAMLMILDRTLRAQD